MTWHLRPATEADLEFLLALHATATLPHAAEAALVQADDEARERVLARLDCARIVVQDGRDVGLVKCVPGHPDWALWQLQLLPGVRGRGLGGDVLRRVVAEATEAGCGVEVALHAGHPAQPLYEREGFEVVREDAGGRVLM